MRQPFKLPLHVAEVLEEEYEALHGELKTKSWAITPGDISEKGMAAINDPSSSLRSRLETAKWDGKGDVPSLVAFFSGKVECSALLPIDGQPWASYTQNRTKLLAKETAAHPPLNKEHVQQINRLMVEETYPELVRTRLSHVTEAIHELSEPRTALCISGGGIRSATFALGVLEGLAHYKLLTKFDYLSTVSGGGYIGSWLSTWIKRHVGGAEGVAHDLDRERSEDIHEPRPVQHLRAYSNYLVPRLGILSADTWTVVATYIRNLVLNWLVLVPLIAFALGVSRGYEWLLRTSKAPITGWGWTIALAAVMAFVSFCYIGFTRPVSNRELKHGSWFGNDFGFLRFCLFPSTVLSVIVTMIWAAMARAHPKLLFIDVAKWTIPVSAGLAFAAWLVYAIRSVGKMRLGFGKLGFELLACIISAGGAGALLAWLATWLFPVPTYATSPYLQFPSPPPTHFAQAPTMELYVVFAVPIVLLALYLQASLFVGLSSALNEDYDREWWARSGGWFILGACGWAAASAISLFGPIAFYHAPAIIGSVGGISGLFAVLLGKSGATAANAKQEEKESKTGMLANFGLALAAPLFVVALLAAVSLLTTKIVNAVITTLPANEEALANYHAQFKSWGEGEYPPRQSPNVEIAPPLKVIRARSDAQPAVDMAEWRSWAHLRSIYDYGQETFFILGGLALLALGFSSAFGVNRFSMHAFYRNRLIRAYLGASRYNRRPNSFTGFDKRDNMPMWNLRPDVYIGSNILDLNAVLAKSKKGGLTLPQLKRIENLARKSDTAGDAGELLVEDLNGLIRGKQKSRAELDKLLHPYVVKGRERPRLFHIINIALNLVSGSNLAFQERMAESFTVSPLHCGSNELGYRSSCEYGDPEGGISIGTAVTISGAAASPNQGYHSSPALAALLTAFNVRLGSWLGNPGIAGDRTYRKPEPRPAVRALLNEAVGATNDEYEWVYLSDGGHFENLGLYEMVLRRCRYIVISDAGCDPQFTFEDLGNAIRKVYIDFGIPISIETKGMLKRDDNRKEEATEGKYFALGTIHYSEVDGGNADERDGCFVYVKPSFYGSEPRDVYSYARASKDFPHETTADQFFSESQFESYRRLGRYTVDQLLQENPTPPSGCIEKFLKWAKTPAEGEAPA